MGLKESVLYEGPPLGARVILNNSNGSFPSAAGVLAGPAPYNFNGAASISSIPVTVKIDDGTVINQTINLTAAVDKAKVTAAELVTAWGSAIVTATGCTGSVDSSTGRFKLAKTTVNGSKFLQVTGEFARLAGFGYGFGAMILPINTQQSIGNEAVQKDSERIEILDSRAEGAAIVTDPKRTGATITLTDSAYDRMMGAILTGGTYDFTTGKVGVPMDTSTRPTFTFEYFVPMYNKGDNQEANFAKVLQRRSQACKVTALAIGAGDRNMQGKTYTISTTAYTDPVTKAKTPDMEETELTPDAWVALNIFNV